jgi:hypothetical protein
MDWISDIPFILAIGDYPTFCSIAERNPNLSQMKALTHELFSELKQNACQFTWLPTTLTFDKISPTIENIQPTVPTSTSYPVLIFFPKLPSCSSKWA